MHPWSPSSSPPAWPRHRRPRPAPFRRVPHPAAVSPLTQLATAITWLWEVGAPLWLLAFWFRATRDRPGRLRALSNRIDLRALMAAIGLFFHACLWFTMNLGPFSLVTSSFYLCLWHHDEYAAAWRRLCDKFIRTDSVRT